MTAGRPPDVFCEVPRGAAICFEVELPETLVRRTTMERLRVLTAEQALETRVVLVGDPDDHERQIAETERMLLRAGLPVRVAAIAPGGGDDHRGRLVGGPTGGGRPSPSPSAAAPPPEPSGAPVGRRPGHSSLSPGRG